MISIRNPSLQTTLRSRDVVVPSDKPWLADNLVWLDAQQPGTLAFNAGGLLQEWRDAFGRTAARPVPGLEGCTSAGVGQEAGVVFAGAQVLAAPLAAGAFKANAARTVLVVFKTTASGTDMGIVKLTGSSYTIGGITHHAGDKIYGYFGSGGSSRGAYCALNIRKVATQRFDGGALAASCLLKVGTANSTVNDSVLPIAATLDALVLGEGFVKYIGTIHELIVSRSALSDTVCAAAIAHLTAKWSLS